FFFALERLIATFAWSWYEKESSSTVLVFIVMDSGSMIWSWLWAGAYVFGVPCCRCCQLPVTHQVEGWSSYQSIFCSANFPDSREYCRYQGSCQTRNSNGHVERTTLCHLFMFGEEKRMIIRAMFDLIIAVYPIVIITYIPFADRVFERSMKRMPHGDHFLKLFSVLHCLCRKRIRTGMVMNETDRYFNMLDAQWTTDASKR
ncbi:hypothetical protein PENTCL1PPCAC_4536, partial [Pristionchus entomophagus]